MQITNLHGTNKFEMVMFVCYSNFHIFNCAEIMQRDETNSTVELLHQVSL